MDLADNLKKSFFNATGSMPDIISSIDHVFGSPPIRLVDGHGKLIGKNCFVLIHDTTLPDLHRYRIDLTLDSGIFHSPDPNYFLYSPEKISCLSCTRNPDFELQYSKLERTLSHLNTQFEAEKREIYLQRFERLRDIYRPIFNENSSPGEKYKQLLISLYGLIGLDKHVMLISSSMKSAYASGIIDKFLPDCIKHTSTTNIGLNYLVKNKLFATPLFQSISENTFINNENYESDTIITDLRAKKIIPSYEVMLWGFALAGISHFGNDYGFLERLSKITKNQTYSYLQITQPKEDGINFINFSDSYSFSVVNIGKKTKLQNISPKKSRINNLCVAYLHYGDYIKDFWHSYIHNGEIQSLSMKEIMI